MVDIDGLMFVVCYVVVCLTPRFGVCLSKN